MYVIAVAMSGPPGRDLPCAPDLADVFWAHCNSADGIEHIRCMSRRTRVGIILFMKASDSDCAVAAAQSVCKRVVSIAPILNGWHLDSCADVTGHPWDSS